MIRFKAFFLNVVALAGATALLVPAMAGSSEAESEAAQIAALKAEVELLRGQLPSQSHAMTDVDYQFTNLWFAARESNWPLASFYLNETRSHINWTVRLHPVRKLSSGQELDLRPLLQVIEQSGLTEIRTALDKHDNKAFNAAYQDTLTQCYSCHLASEKPFLRPRIPTDPATHLIQVKPGH